MVIGYIESEPINQNQLALFQNGANWLLVIGYRRREAREIDAAKEIPKKEIPEQVMPKKKCQTKYKNHERITIKAIQKINTKRNTKKEIQKRNTTKDIPQKKYQKNTEKIYQKRNIKG